MSDRICILVVEDDTILREGFKKLLEMSGYAVLTAIHGMDALKEIRASPTLPSLILLDLNMPVMSGKEFISELRSMSAELARIPILVVTAATDADVTGVVGIVSKPFKLKDVLGRIRSILDPGP